MVMGSLQRLVPAEVTFFVYFYFLTIFNFVLVHFVIVQAEQPSKTGDLAKKFEAGFSEVTSCHLFFSLFICLCLDFEQNSIR